jgi:hypothetical protein
MELTTFNPVRHLLPFSGIMCPATKGPLSWELLGGDGIIVSGYATGI